MSKFKVLGVSRYVLCSIIFDFLGASVSKYLRNPQGAHETQVTTEKIDSADTLAAVAAMIRREARRMAKNREKGKDTRAERRKTMVKVGVGLVVASVAVVVGMIENGEIDLGDDEEPEGEDEGEDGGEGSSEPEPVREVREDEDQGYRMRRISNWVQTAAQG